MVRVYRASLDLRQDIHARLQSNDRPSLRGLLTRWCSNASSNTSRLPKFLVFPLQPCGSSSKLCQEVLNPTSLDRVQALLELAGELNLLCYLAEVTCKVSSIPPSTPLKDESKPAELLRLENLDGSRGQDGTDDPVKFAQSFFVPPNVYTRRAEALPKDKQKSNLVLRINDLVFIPLLRQRRRAFANIGLGSTCDTKAVAVRLCSRNKRQKQPCWVYVQQIEGSEEQPER